jgi:hypothetical protein
MDVHAAENDDMSDPVEQSYTIDQWCRNRKVSRAMFYVLAEKGLAPRTHYIGSKRLVSDQADREWLAAREAEAAADSDAA